MKKIKLNGWSENAAWDNSKNLEILYKKRCQKKIEEMTCHSQLSLIIKKNFKKGDTPLDVGCGSGYLYHSLVKNKLNIKYYGIDASKKLLEIGKKYLPKYGLSSDRLIHSRFEDLSTYFDHIVCINVLTYHDNILKPLDIFLKYAKKSVILRESISNKSTFKYVKDNYLNKGVNIKTYINTYDSKVIKKFLKSSNYNYKFIKDIHSNREPQNVIDHKHYWKFLHITK